MIKLNLASVVALALLAATITVAMVRPSLAVTVLNAVTCATTTACVSGNNTDGGPGVQGTSASNKGVVGQTKFNSTSPSNGQAGVLGQDLSTSGTHDNGVSGKSVRGSGVFGTSSSAAGVLATSTSGSGVFASSGSGAGVKAQTSSGAEAILGTAATSIGVFGTVSTSGTGVVGTTPSGLGVEGSATSGTGVFGNGSTGLEGQDNASSHADDIFANGLGANLIRANNSHGIDVLTVFDSGLLRSFEISAGSSAVATGVIGNGALAGVQGSPAVATAFGVVGNNTGNGASVAFYANSFGGFEFVGNGSNGLNNFTVDNVGNVHAHAYFADLAYHTPSANGAILSTYSHESRSPTIEDFGEATLAAGHAYVRLDPAFAGALVRGIPYFVYITPMGPTRGSLYVTQRTPTGFYVRENGVGGSTVAFDYRIVGKRYMPTAPRLQATTRWPKVMPVMPTFPRHPKVLGAAPR